ncbi:hypothetical protein [Mycobacterium sp. OTB74]|uniref:hypothetical protein n=1 Tax=Mycobacterium sp. OTB74 TaxID=1853452 RepID=UPI0024759309|nr:hypothetical protein [Mycobacterium sp. OTB74]MDH6246501.1 hypothetical protein [Mycobacterium sp. OTB74]
MILSLTSPGIQSVTDVEAAVRLARDTNDALRQQFIDKRPDRFSMFACVATRTRIVPPSNWSAPFAIWVQSA